MLTIAYCYYLYAITSEIKTENAQEICLKTLTSLESGLYPTFPSHKQTAPSQGEETQKDRKTVSISTHKHRDFSCHADGKDLRSPKSGH